MEIYEHTIPFHLPLAKEYAENFANVADLFDYDPESGQSFHDRYQTILQYGFRCPRTGLTAALRSYNARIGNHRNSLDNIDRLEHKNAVVVIGGQQPGILTGPLYTIYKAITIIRLARREEERLGVPVIPVFWIAGEDHDWDEVSQLYALDKEHRLCKWVFRREGAGKDSISRIPIDQNKLAAFIDQFFGAQTQTEHTPGLREEIHTLARESGTLSEFFARVMARLFGDEGLVLFDSADPVFRDLEGEMFARIIEENEAISRLLEQTRSEVMARGFPPQVESQPEQAHLFLYEDGERIPLLRVQEDFRLRNRNRIYSHEELRLLSLSDPRRFSCNVVTRPLMQEYLFPVLAFVGGPGEISYWGLYRRIFHHLGFRMPVIVPRITATLVERHVLKVKEQYGMTFEDLIHRLDDKWEEWLKSQDDYGYRQQFDRVRREIGNLYGSLLDTLEKIDPQLKGLGENNLSRILDQVSYLENRTRRSFENRHMTVLHRFERAKASLMPGGKPQERVLNLFSFLNRYGWEWWRQLKSLPLKINGKHKEIRL